MILHTFPNLTKCFLYQKSAVENFRFVFAIKSTQRPYLIQSRFTYTVQWYSAIILLTQLLGTRFGIGFQTVYFYHVHLVSSFMIIQ